MITQILVILVIYEAQVPFPEGIFSLGNFTSQKGQ